MKTSTLNIWKEEVVALRDATTKKQENLNELNSLLREEENKHNMALISTREKINNNTQSIDALQKSIQEYDDLISKIVGRIAEEAINAPEPTLPDEQVPTEPSEGSEDSSHVN